MEESGKEICKQRGAETRKEIGRNMTKEARQQRKKQKEYAEEENRDKEIEIEKRSRNINRKEIENIKEIKEIKNRKKGNKSWVKRKNKDFVNVNKA